MEEFAKTFQAWLTGFSLLGIFACFIAALVTMNRKAAIAFWKNSTPARRVVLILFACVAIVVGGTKPQTPTISYPYTDIEKRYLVDNGSRVNPDSVYISFTAIGIPTSADFNGFYRELGNTNDTDWVQFITGTIGAFLTPVEVPFPAATNYNFCFFTTYQPEPSVHTNGVLNVKWGLPQASLGYVVEGDTLKALPLQTEVRTDWAVIATPAQTHDLSTLTDDPEAEINLLEELMEETNDEQ